VLINLTALVDFCALVLTLWLAFYLLGRGFPSPTTLRAVIVLFALSFFFASAFVNFFYQIEGTTALRALLLVVGMVTWYSLTYNLLPSRDKKRLHWLRLVVYSLGTVTAILLIGTSDAFIDEGENLLWVGRMGIGIPYITYGFFQLLVAGGIMYNLVSGEKIGLKPQGRYLLFATLFPILAIGYGILALAITPPMPRLVQDLLIFSGVFLLGLSIARYQLLVERRTILLDLPVSGLVLLGLAAIYAWLAWLGDMPILLVAAVTVFAIFTHSIYDLGREYLERLRMRHESSFRKQLRKLEFEVTDEASLNQCLKEGLDLLCRTLNACSGFIAVRQDETFFVAATQRSIPVGAQLNASEFVCEDIAPPETERFPEISWMAPVFEADRQVAIIGIGKPKNRLNYSADDLDLLGEVADRVGTIVSLSRAQPMNADRLLRFVSEVQTNATNLRFRTNEMMATMANSPEPELVKMVEEGLRNLDDYISLGQSLLVDWVGVKGESHIERGKKLQQILIDAIEALRPAGPRPGEPLPRVWYNYAILHDAYVECVPNREIMARLFISEGTFNRTRRNALRGLARLFTEHKKMIPVAK
jgi:hypothetical protein